MKTMALLTLAMALGVLGCRYQGSSSDDYNTERGTSITNNYSTNGTNNGLRDSRSDTNKTNSTLPDNYPPQPQP